MLGRSEPSVFFFCMYEVWYYEKMHWGESQALCGLVLCYGQGPPGFILVRLTF